MKNITQSFGLIGLLCILFGSLSVLLTGIRGYFFYGQLALGVLLVVAFGILHTQSFVGFFGKKGAKRGGHTFIYSLIAFSIIAALNYISYSKLHTRFDLTQDKVHTLADQSVQVVKNLESDVSVEAYFKDSNQSAEIARQLLQRYADQSQKLTFRFIDPDDEPELAMSAGAKDGSVFFKSGLQRHLVEQLSEDVFTNALITVGRSVKPVVYSLASHGCRSVDDEGEEGLSSLKKAVENEGYTFKRLENLNAGVPEDALILIVGGPNDPFSERDVEQLDQFLERGGNAFFMLDPKLPDPRFATTFKVLDNGLEDFFMDRGVLLGHDMILERHMVQLVGIATETSVFASTYGTSIITDKLQGKVTFFKDARSLSPVHNNTFTGKTNALIKSAGQGASWAESKIDDMLKKQRAAPDPEDVKGPVTLAMSVERKGSQPEQENLEMSTEQTAAYRMIVVGDSDFANNVRLEGYDNNQDFLLNGLNWLAGIESQISIRPKKIKSSHLALDAKKSNVILYVAVLGIPQLIMVFGLIIWQWRRKR